jgi:hypothetical protein
MTEVAIRSPDNIGDLVRTKLSDAEQVAIHSDIITFYQSHSDGMRWFSFAPVRMTYLIATFGFQVLFYFAYRFLRGKNIAEFTNTEIGKKGSK